MLYRGITLALSSYKLYCGVLNTRLTCKLDESDCLNDEQNGFRKDRSTIIDLLYTLTTKNESRKLRKLSTFCAFIDFKMAYDWVNSLLFTKLESQGISSKMLKVLYAIYSNVQSCVKINGQLTELFDVTSGLKQGCILPPLLFNIFINDLIDEVKKLNVGIKLDNDIISVLFIC